MTQPQAHGFDPSRDHVCVALRGVTVEAQVGLHPWERHKERPTRLKVTAEMYAYRLEGKTPFIDYDRVRDYLRGWAARPHTDLLETLLDDLAQHCLADPQVAACRVSIAKPDIFNEADCAEVTLWRSRA